MLSCSILGTGIASTGLPNWHDAHPVLAGNTPYVATPLPRLTPSILPANERRRANDAIRLALEVADQAVQMSGIDPAHTATVFASASGDSNVIHTICQALCAPSPTLSPTTFHNSVHNAPAGYWSIATQATSSYTAISASDGTMAMGLIEAVTQVIIEGKSVLLVSYEVPIPFPLNEQLPAHAPFACALVLGQAAAPGCQGFLEMTFDGEGNETSLSNPALEMLRQDNAAARALPLLSLLAMGRTGDAILPLYRNQRLRLHYTPC